MDFTLVELSNLNILSREGFCQLVQKNISADMLQAALDALKKLDKVIKQAQMTPKQPEMVQETAKIEKVSKKKSEVV